MGRGQAGVEYTVMFGLSLAILLVVWIYVGMVNEDFRQDLRVGFAKQTALRLADAANAVLVQGPPARIYVDVDTPEGLTYAYPDGNASCTVSEVLLRLAAQQGMSTDVPASLVANVTGDISFLVNNPGPKRLWVEALDYNGRPCVRIYGG